MSDGVPDAVLGLFQILVRQLFREETIEVMKTKGATVSSETIWNEVQVARTSGRVHGRISPSLPEELFDGSDAIRVTFSDLTPIIHETRSACFGVPAEVQNCETVPDGLSFVLKSFAMSSPILASQPCQLATRCWRTNF